MDFTVRSGCETGMMESGNYEDELRFKATAVLMSISR